VALARAGTSLSTAEILAFQSVHAAARDAVHWKMDTHALEQECRVRGWQSLTLQSAAPDRITYLRRPDLGRRLGVGQLCDLGSKAFSLPVRSDLTIILADGLSALAIHRHALELCARLLPLLEQANWRVSPLILVEQARVAIGDAIGEKMQASLSLVLIGERPGLSAADSLGAYLTWNPVPGRTDAERNCISNIRPAGLDYVEAAQRIFLLLTAARSLRLTGVALKETKPSIGTS
jgi:ethanolamine ammonia-lyase small subunit